MATNRQRALRALIACAFAGLGIAACGTGSGGSGSGKSISIWEGYTGAEQREFTKLVNQYEKASGVKVNVLQVNNDNSLQKVLTAVRGGTQPDIAYVYGSWAPNVAKIPQVVNLTKVVQKPSVNWNDFWVGEGAHQAVDQAVRHGLRHAWLRGHGLALGGAALGGRRPDPELLEHQGGV